MGTLSRYMVVDGEIEAYRKVPPPEHKYGSTEILD